MKPSRGARRDNLFCRFFSVSHRLNFIFAWNCLMFAPINSLSLSLSHSFFVTQIFVETFEGEVFQKTVRDAITGAALSNNTLTRWIESMGKDLREEIYEDFRSSPYTALAIHESTDITLESQLLVYGKFACGCRKVEALLCCLTLHSTTTGHDILALWMLFSRRISLIGVVY